jgi:hypothetical protein
MMGRAEAAAAVLVVRVNKGPLGCAGVSLLRAVRPCPAVCCCRLVWGSGWSAWTATERLLICGLTAVTGVLHLNWAVGAVVDGTVGLLLLNGCRAKRPAGSCSVRLLATGLSQISPPNKLGTSSAGDTRS